MAITLDDLLTEWDDCDGDNWTGDASSGEDADFMREGTGCIGVDVDIETVYIKGADQTATDLSSNFIYVWMMSLTPITLDTKSAGGMQIVLEDSGADASYWYVGGSDTYFGGWQLFVISTAETPDGNSGTAATLTDITNIGVRWKGVAKSKLSQNCFVDWIRYGTGPALRIHGTNTTANDMWSEVFTADDTNAYGIVSAIPGGYLLKGPLMFGKNAINTTLTDTGATLVWADMPVGNSHYEFTYEDSTGATFNTVMTWGTVVGSGDDRQGVNGTTVSTEGPSWGWDLIADVDAKELNLYGCVFRSGKAIMNFDAGVTANPRKIIGCTFINCAPVVVADGGASITAEMLNCTIIDPESDGGGNQGLKLAADSGSIIDAQVVKNITFVTSGTPTTQRMVWFPYTGGVDYNWDMLGFFFFGTYSGTIDMGQHDGSSISELTIDVGGDGGNILAADFYLPNSGTVVVNNDISITLTGMKDNTEVRVYDVGTGVEIAGIEDATAGSPDDRTFTFQDVASNVVDIVVFNKNWIMPPDNRIRDYTIPGSNTSLPITQIEDRVYENP